MHNGLKRLMILWTDRTFAENIKDREEFRIKMLIIIDIIQIVEKNLIV